MNDSEKKYNRPIRRNYRYLGDRMTDHRLKGAACTAILRPDGKCIRGRNGNMLVRFGTEPVVVVARLLRRTD